MRTETRDSFEYALGGMLILIFMIAVLAAIACCERGKKEFRDLPAASWMPGPDLSS